MFFNSFEFLFFLPIVFILFWSLKTKKKQNVLLVIASYVFYGWWDWRFLTLIILSSFIDFFVGKKIEHTKENKKHWLIISLLVNLGLLFTFKYFNFFVDSLYSSLGSIGIQSKSLHLNIVLPVGISFYTFQTLSYSIDVYREKMKASHDIVAFFAYVSFFPQLVAGPIERAENFLPQFERERRFSKSDASDGLRQILWGLFKKIIIADGAAVYVNLIFENHQAYSSLTLVLATVLFAFQIYGDFSGYSDIAIGTARLFDFNLMKNFALPYFSRDIAEFWRRWHISLSTWFKDYLYIPLGGSRGSMQKKLRNTFIIFVVSGLWHGANWTYVVWGALNAIYFIPLLLASKNRSNIEIVAQGKFLPSFKESALMLFTFVQVSIAWIFFRSDSISNAFSYIAHIIKPLSTSIDKIPTSKYLIALLLFLTIEWLQRSKEHTLEISKLPAILRWSIYILLPLFMFFTIDATANCEFIYFQF